MIKIFLLKCLKISFYNEYTCICKRDIKCFRLGEMSGRSLHRLDITAAAAAAKSLQLCPTLCDSIDSSPPDSPVPGILQARTLEWGAIAFSGISLGQSNITENVYSWDNLTSGQLEEGYPTGQQPQVRPCLFLQKGSPSSCHILSES